MHICTCAGQALLDRSDTPQSTCDAPSLSQRTWMRRQQRTEYSFGEWCNEDAHHLRLTSHGVVSKGATRWCCCLTSRLAKRTDKVSIPWDQVVGVRLTAAFPRWVVVFLQGLICASLIALSIFGIMELSGANDKLDKTPALNVGASGLGFALAFYLVGLCLFRARVLQVFASAAISTSGSNCVEFRLPRSMAFTSANDILD
ncbi:MAG: hypothetical protein MHM6MM_007508, partial [Cercozoa sp. M6MM]